MKTRNFLWGLLASAMLVGCSQNDDAPGAEGGKDTPAYVAVNINFVKDGMSRAAVDGTGFEEGNKTENKVTQAHFFFFDESGNAYDVSQRTPGANSNNGSSTNCVSMTIEAEGVDGTGTDNVERDLESIVVIHTKDGKYPTDMVTVLNLDLDASFAPMLSKNDLMNKLANYNNSNGYVMSNSVYLNKAGTKYINSSTLSPENVKETDSEAMANPVYVYVERLAAKVTVNLDEDGTYIWKDGDATVLGFKVLDSGTSSQMSVDIDGVATPVYVKILGWELNTTANNSYLIKNLDEYWISTNPFTLWNDADNFRSYWAKSNESGNFTKSFDWGTKVDLNAPAYCNENTTSATNKTKVLVKALLCNVDKSALDLYQWAGNYYSQNGLKQAIVNAYKDRIYKNDGTAIVIGDIELLPGWDRDGNGEIDNDDTDGDNANNDTEHKSEYYKAYFGLSNYAGWYKDNSHTTEWTEGDLKNLFNEIPFAYAWEEGKTYYYTDIEHFENQIGVVRNHHYKVEIQNVYGLGTPVIGTDVDDPDIPEVVTPEDKQHYIAAKINILSWKVVSSGVELGKK